MNVSRWATMSYFRTKIFLEHGLDVSQGVKIGKRTRIWFVVNKNRNIKASTYNPHTPKDDLNVYRNDQEKEQKTEKREAKKKKTKKKKKKVLELSAE